MASTSRLVVLVLVASLPAASASAQGQGGAQAPRPIFGGGASRVGQSLSLGLSLGHGLFRTERRLAGEAAETREDSQFTFGSGNLSYGLSGARAGLSLTAATSGQYYSELTDEILHGYAGVAGVWLKFSNRTQLNVTHGLTYQPGFQATFQSLLDPTLLANVPTTDVAASDEAWLSQDTRFSLGHAVSRRSSLTIDYGRRVVDFGTDDEEQATQDVGVRYTHQISRGLGARLGYRFSTTAGSMTDAETPGLHAIDAGLDFNRSFSPTRRTTIGFGTGSSLVKTRGGTTQFFLTGTGTVAQALARTWSASISAGRNVNFVDGLRDPVLSDTATASLGGSLGRRARLQAFATALRGQVLAGADDDDTFLTYTMGTGFGFDVSRSVSWSLNYAHQRSDYGEVEFVVGPQLRSFHVASTGTAIALSRYVSLNANYAYATVGRQQSNLSPTFRRHSVMVSIGTSLPLYGSVRK